MDRIWAQTSSTLLQMSAIRQTVAAGSARMKVIVWFFGASLSKMSSEQERNVCNNFTSIVMLSTFLREKLEIYHRTSLFPLKQELEFKTKKPMKVYK